MTITQSATNVDLPTMTCAEVLTQLKDWFRTSSDIKNSVRDDVARLKSLHATDPSSFTTLQEVANHLYDIAQKNPVIREMLDCLPNDKRPEYAKRVKISGLREALRLWYITHRNEYLEWRAQTSRHNPLFSDEMIYAKPHSQQ